MSDGFDVEGHNRFWKNLESSRHRLFVDCVENFQFLSGLQDLIFSDKLPKISDNVEEIKCNNLRFSFGGFV